MEKVKNQILKTTELVKETAKEFEKMKKQEEKIKADVSKSTLYKSGEIEKSRFEFINFFADFREKTITNLIILDNIATEIEENIEYSPEFIQVLEVIEATRGELPEGYIRKIKKAFSDNYNILLVLDAVFKKYNKKYDFGRLSAGQEVNQLQSWLSKLTFDKCYQLRTLFNMLIQFGTSRGINFTKTDTEFIDTPYADEIIARKAMGLPQN